MLSHILSVTCKEINRELQKQNDQYWSTVIDLQPIMQTDKCFDITVSLSETIWTKISQINQFT